jgi:hypothetical protein
VKRLLAALAVVAGVMGAVGTARAHDHYDDSQSHPLRVAAYMVNPVGWALEWMIFRPMHFLVSNPDLEQITGHHPHEVPYGEYRAYQDPDEEY